MEAMFFGQEWMESHRKHTRLNQGPGQFLGSRRHEGRPRETMYLVRKQDYSAILVRLCILWIHRPRYSLLRPG
jgi:hypothetical protein